MLDLENSLVTFFSYTLNLSSFLQNPGFQERILLLVVNVLCFVPTVAVLVLSWLVFKNHRRWVFRITAALFFALPLILRTTVEYAYDTPFGYLALLSDISGLLYVLWKFGSALLPRGSQATRIVSAVSCAVCLALLATLLGANGFLSVPTIIGHALWTTLLVCLFWVDSFDQEKMVLVRSWAVPKLWKWVFVVVFFLPLVPYIGAAGPPDADSTTISEMIGYLLQGQNLQHVLTGLPNEWLSVRYPAGLPAFCWMLAHLLNIRASESLLIVWIVAWFLFLWATLQVAKGIRAGRVVTLVFTFTTTVTGAFGLAGGQIQEMLTYTLGLVLISSVLDGEVLLAALCLAAGLSLQPIVALPFGLVFFFFYLETAIKKKNFSSLFLGSLLVLASAAYCYSLGIGGQSLKPTQVAEMLQRLTWPTFLAGMWFWLLADTHYLFLFILPPIVYGFWLSKNSEATRISVVFLIWLIGGMLINGVFGDTKSMHFTATFQAGFSVVGIWALGMGWCFSRISGVLTHTKANQFIAGGGLILLWIVFCFPGFYLQPFSVFVTHSDVRMGRWIEKNLPMKGTLIANHVPFSETWNSSARVVLSYDRGNSLRNTLFSRVSTDHQVKSGQIVDRRPYLDAYKQGIEANIRNYHQLGVSHLLVPARPESKSFVKSSPVAPIAVFGSTYLFQIPSLGTAR